MQELGTGARVGDRAAKLLRAGIAKVLSVWGIVGGAFMAYTQAVDGFGFSTWLLDAFLHWRTIVLGVARSLLFFVPNLSDRVVQELLVCLFLLSFGLGARLAEGGQPRGSVFDRMLQIVTGWLSLFFFVLASALITVGGLFIINGKLPDSITADQYLLLFCGAPLLMIALFLTLQPILKKFPTLWLDGFTFNATMMLGALMTGAWNSSLLTMLCPMLLLITNSKSLLIRVGWVFAVLLAFAAISLLAFLDLPDDLRLSPIFNDAT